MPNALLSSDRQVAQRILEHLANGTTDIWPGETWREPVANYFEPSRFDAEIGQVFRPWPVVFCPAAALPEPGSYLAREAAGIPLLVVRGDDGQVRAFRNACRHRGMQLAAGEGCARAFSCQYHGWTYRLDGSLRHIPGEHGFPGLDKSLHGLVPVRVWERHGLIFVSQDGGKDVMPQAVLSAIDGLIAPQDRLFRTRERELDANWKLFLESFIEGYHIKPAHKDTFFPFGYDNLNLHECFGSNSRVVFPFRRIEKLKDGFPDPLQLNGLLTDVYQIFPSTIIAVLSYHTTVIVLEPLSASKTRMLTYSLTRGSGSESEKLARAEKDADFVDKTGQVEDRDIVCAIQRGLHSRANDVLSFGKFEGAIIHFHSALRAALGTD